MQSLQTLQAKQKAFFMHMHSNTKPYICIPIYSDNLHRIFFSYIICLFSFKKHGDFNFIYVFFSECWQCFVIYGVIKRQIQNHPQTFDFKMSTKKQNKTFEPALSNIQISVWNVYKLVHTYLNTTSFAFLNITFQKMFILFVLIKFLMLSVN